MPQFDAKDKQKFETFSRRSLLATGGMTAIFAVLVGRLYQLQIVNGDEYMMAAEDNRVNQRLVAPPRGRIFDRFGVQLAGNRRNYRALVVPEQAPQGMAAAVDALAKVIPITPRQRERVLKDAAQGKPFIPVVVVENMSWEDYSRLSLDLPYLSGVQPDIGDTRDYPFGPMLSHVLGYVAPVSREEKARAAPDDLLMQIPGYRMGKRGIEKALDTEIRGEPGATRVEVNAYGRVIRELARNPGEMGAEVYLTIDQELQKFAYQALSDQSGAVAVLDVHTGDVLALLSTPGFDPNAFNVGVSTEQWKSWHENDHLPLINKVLSGIYPPGSTFKPIAALCGLESGAVNADTRFSCGGGMAFGGRVFHCWKRGGHGSLDLRQAIQHSCDVYFYNTAIRTGVDNIYKTATKLGLGRPTGIEIPGEKGGTIPSTEWKLRTYHEKWQPGDVLSAGIGQGYVVTTPIQLALASARIASGLDIKPRIVHTVGTELRDHHKPQPLDIDPKHLQVVREGMNKVANEPGGTAYRWRIPDPGCEMAGKTGTAQVRVISAAERATGVRKDATLPWKLRDHALYIAFAPVQAPRYAASIILEHGSIPEHIHVQMVRDILLYAQRRDTLGLPTAYPVSAADARSGPDTSGLR